MTETQVQVRQGIDYDEFVQVDRVHSRIYTDPAIFEDEIQRIFHRGWVFIGHAAEVPDPGDFVTSMIGRQPIVISRGDDGSVNVLMNRCTHRGLTICQEATGSSKYFKCAYHGWTFRNSGELIGVPYPEGYGPDFRKDDLALARPPRVDSYRGFLFASLSPSGESFEHYLPEAVRRQIDFYLDLSPTGEIECPTGRTMFSYGGNWKFIVENTADAYHINFLHHSLLDVTTERVAKSAPGGKGPDLTQMAGGNSPALNVSLGHGHSLMDMHPLYRQQEADRAGARLRDALIDRSGTDEYRQSMIEAYGEERATEVMTGGGTHVGLWPNGGALGSMIRRIQPVAVDRTEVYLTPTLLKGVPAHVNTARLRGHEGFFPPAGMGGTDDAETFERQQFGMQADVNPWVVISRGLHREVVQADGTIASQVTDESSSRAIYAQWKAAMQQETPRSD